MKLPKTTEPPLVSRIKILSNLKIDEHRIPQDGQFTVMVDKNRLTCVSQLAQLYGANKVVIRLLDKAAPALNWKIWVTAAERFAPFAKVLRIQMV